ncbi:MAG: esterase family protein [Propionibacteriaceae bacterium]|jgi:enterochelin esterase-like enzyme|nr:esterase family protein [Propionibacteriaceae bacterium]
MDLDDPIDISWRLVDDWGTDWLATYWPAAVAWALAAVCLAALLLLRRLRPLSSRRRRSAQAAAWGSLGGLSLILGVALAVNTWVGYFPSGDALGRWLDRSRTELGAVSPAGDGTDPAAPAQRGRAFQTVVEVEGHPADGAWVYLPPGYDAAGDERRYPVVYALHGAPGSAADWFAGGQIDVVVDGLIDAGAVPPLIVVAPDLNGGGQPVGHEPLNHPGGAQVEDYVVRDVVAWADRRLRTLADADHRMVAGMSAGGFGALVYGLHSPEVFAGVISIMPYTIPQAADVLADPAALRRNSPLELIAARPGASGQQIFLGQGDRESSAEAEAINQALRAQGQDSTLRIYPGLDHNWTAARAIMPYGLVWVAQRLGWERPA